MQRYSFILVLLIGIFACQQKANKKATKKRPKDLLKEEKFEEILLDIHIAEADLKENVKDKKREIKARKYYTQIFKLHDVDKADFLKTYRYYQQHPQQFEEFYEELLAELSKQKALAEAN